MSVRPTYENTLAVLSAHRLCSDDELLKIAKAELAVAKPAYEAAMRKGVGWFQTAKTTAVKAQALWAQKNRVTQLERSVQALEKKDYRDIYLVPYAKEKLGAGYENLVNDGFDLVPTPAWRLQELNERTSVSPELTAIWTKWLESNKPLRRINLVLLDRAALECSRMLQLEAQEAGDLEARQAALTNIRRPKP